VDKMWIKKPEVKQSKVSNHLFEDGEKVRIKETGEIVTIDHWWYASNQRSWTTQYNIVEHPSTWYSEHELQKINITGVVKMEKLKEQELKRYEELEKKHLGDFDKKTGIYYEPEEII
jgi:hypothetical protein